MNERMCLTRFVAIWAKKVEIFDVTGRSVLKTELETDALDIRSIGAGLYLLKVSIGDRSSTEKIIIK